MIPKSLLQNFFPLPMRFGMLLLFCLLAFLATPSGARTPSRPLPAGEIVGTVAGLNGSTAMVTLGSDGFLRTAKTDAAGKFEFKQVPQGRYFLKAEAKGFALGPAREVRLDNAATSNEDPIRKPPRVSAAFEAESIADNRFTYHWQADVSRGGYETSANIVAPPVIKFLGTEVSTPDFSAAMSLRNDYGIILSDEQMAWSLEHASRLLLTMKSIPQTKRVKPSKWVLVDTHIAGDIRIEPIERIEAGGQGDKITLSSAAMVYANPKMVLLDGVKGRFFSKRLHHALVRFVTDNGNSQEAASLILRDRFGVGIDIPDYSHLTATTTREDQSRFTRFRPAELIEIINMFEEMPTGFHVTKGLKYLVRRGFGHTHPVNGTIAAAWTAAGYIEFTDAAFANLAQAHRIILHEKSHFLWAHTFGEKIRDGWIKVGAWRPDASAPSGWSTGKTTEFVSAYAHQKNPDEDMAESLAAWILNPALLKSRSLAKYEFIRTNIMHGDVFISEIRNDLQFDVLNLFPDYDYPGKIKRVDLVVDGAPEADKTATIEIELDFVEGKQGGATGAIITLVSETGTFTAAHLLPKNGNPYVLRGDFSLSKYAKGGYWSIFQTRVFDATGNMRYEGKGDFGWKMWLNSPLEIKGHPDYVPNSLAITKLPSVVVEGREVQKLAVSWRINEHGKINEYGGVRAQLSTASSPMPFGEFGRYDHATKTATVEFTITEFHATGEYWVSWISAWDTALNQSVHNFYGAADDEPLTRIMLNTTNPDLEGPVMDVNRITITAKPVKPLAPDGETVVNIVHYIKEEKSGLRHVTFNLRNPQGELQHFAYAPPNPGNKLFSDAGAGWMRYEFPILLPVGSAPGRWGLESVVLYDKLYNYGTHSFLELLHFEVVP